MRLMKSTMLAAAATLWVMCSPTLAQEQPQADTPPGGVNVVNESLERARLGPFLPDPPSEQGVCPPSGYAPPKYVLAGDNDGILNAFEVASPCNTQELRDAAEAIGMGRYRPIVLKSLLTIRFTAKGYLAPGLGLGADTQVLTHMNFLTDSVRLEAKAPRAKPVVHVVDDGLAWDEATAGEGFSPAPKGAAAERSPLLKLTPFGALLSIIEAEGHATQRQVDGRWVMSGASPYDKVQVTIAFNAQKEPETVEFKDHGHAYKAVFSGYSTKWEPGYWYVFPERMVWTRDGKPLADLTVVEYKSNPYLVFPRPPFIKTPARF